MSQKIALRLMALAVALLAAPVVAQQADLRLTLDGGDAPQLSVGGPAGTFFATVTNAGPDPATDVRVAVALPDGTAVASIGPSCAGAADGGFPCTLGTLASGASATFSFKVRWPAPDPLPATCPTGLDLTADVTAAESDPSAADNRATVSAVTAPLADLTATAQGPGVRLADGGTPSDRASAGDSLTYHGTVTNRGPCAVPAGALTLDASLDDTASLGLTFVSGSGGCRTWSVSAPPSSADGVCTVDAALAAGSTLSFEVNERVQPLVGAADGGDSIIQTAAYFNFIFSYPGNPATAPGDDEAPMVTTLVKGPASSFGCSATGALAPALVLALLWALYGWRPR